MLKIRIYVLAFVAFQDHLTGNIVVLMLDNSTVVEYLSNQGGTSLRISTVGVEVDRAS